jgi:uncharacterized protein YraI
MKKAVAVISVIFLALSAQPAQAAAKVKVLSASKVSTKTGASDYHCFWTTKRAWNLCFPVHGN